MVSTEHILNLLGQIQRDQWTHISLLQEVSRQQTSLFQRLDEMGRSIAASTQERKSSELPSALFAKHWQWIVVGTLAMSGAVSGNDLVTILSGLVK